METIKLTINGQEVPRRRRAADRGVRDERRLSAALLSSSRVDAAGFVPDVRSARGQSEDSAPDRMHDAGQRRDGRDNRVEEVEETRAAMINSCSNHPVDCPVCDRAGECELQDQTYGFGEDRTRSQYSDKENFLERRISPFIYNDPQRCVVCKRCTRVCEEWMDEFAITAINRGSATLISSFSGWVECSDCGNCVDVCPTGTLLHTPYKYIATLGLEANADGLQLLL